MQAWNSLVHGNQMSWPIKQGGKEYRWYLSCLAWWLVWQVEEWWWAKGWPWEACWTPTVYLSGIGITSSFSEGTAVISTSSLILIMAGTGQAQEASGTLGDDWGTRLPKTRGVVPLEPQSANGNSILSQTPLHCWHNPKSLDPPDFQIQKSSLMPPHTCKPSSTWEQWPLLLSQQSSSPGPPSDLPWPSASPPDNFIVPSVPPVPSQDVRFLSCDGCSSQALQCCYWPRPSSSLCVGCECLCLPPNNHASPLPSSAGSIIYMQTVRASQAWLNLVDIAELQQTTCPAWLRSLS